MKRWCFFLVFVWSMNVSTAFYWVCIACHCVFETIISFKYSRGDNNKKKFFKFMRQCFGTIIMNSFKIVSLFFLCVQKACAFMPSSSKRLFLSSQCIIAHEKDFLKNNKKIFQLDHMHAHIIGLKFWKQKLHFVIEREVQHCRRSTKNICI